MQSLGLQAPRVSPGVAKLLWAFAICFVIQKIASVFLGWNVEAWLGFSPEGLFSGYIWQPLTYPFLHGGLFHLLINLASLYLFGSELERLWGTRRFLSFFALCSVGGAVLQTLVWLIALPLDSEFAATVGAIPIVGASGGLYGLLVAFGVLYGRATLLAFFVIPIQARYFVMILAGIEVYSAVFHSQSGVAHLVHLGGLVAGFALLKWRGPHLKGGGGGGGGFFRSRKKVMDREELRRRLQIIVNNDKEPQTKDKKYPITWNSIGLRPPRFEATA